MAQGSTAKADFLANISHELRTPVTVAKGIAYVLKNPAVPDEERNEFLGQLTGSLDKLMGIVDELITLSELERGTFELSLVETDLAPLVRHALDEVRMRYPGIPIAAEVADGLLCMADGPRLGAVVRELLDNACRYSPFGRRRGARGQGSRRGRDRDGDRPRRGPRSRRRGSSLRAALLHR